MYGADVTVNGVTENIEIRSKDKSIDVTDTQNKRNSWNPDRYDIGIKMLKDRREKITSAGKYTDRYKDTFTHEVPKEEKFPLSAKCRDTLEQYRKVSKGEKPDVSPVVGTKHHHPTLTTEMMKLNNSSKSNATNDLNKQENALIGYKLVPDNIHKNPLHSTSPISTPKTPKWPRKHKDVNIYSINPTDTSPIAVTPPGFPPKQQGIGLNLILNGPSSPESTMSHLQNVENIITKLNEKEKKEENLKKFEELLKKMNVKEAKPAAPEPIEKTKDETNGQRQSQETVLKHAVTPKTLDKSQDILKSQEHILNPIKHCSEVEDLQARGLCEPESESHEPFKRHVKERKSMDNAHSKESKTNKNLHLSRTASDAQDKAAKRPPRVARERTRKVSSSFILTQKKSST